MWSNRVMHYCVASILMAVCYGMEKTATDGRDTTSISALQVLSLYSLYFLLTWYISLFWWHVFIAFLTMIIVVIKINANTVLSSLISSVITVNVEEEDYGVAWLSHYCQISWMMHHVHLGRNVSKQEHLILDSDSCESSQSPLKRKGYSLPKPSLQPGCDQSFLSWSFCSSSWWATTSSPSPLHHQEIFNILLLSLIHHPILLFNLQPCISHLFYSPKANPAVPAPRIQTHRWRKKKDRLSLDSRISPRFFQSLRKLIDNLIPPPTRQ